MMAVSLPHRLNSAVWFISGHFLAVCFFAYSVPILWYWLIGLDNGHAVWRDQLDWILTSYAANYLEHGLIRRGLIGTILAPIARPRLELVVVALNIAFITSLIFVVDRLTRVSQRRHGADAWSLAVIRALFAMSPFTVIYFGHAFGMLDLPNLMLLLACVAVVESNNTSAAIALSIIAVLIHEAFLFYGVPLVAALLARDRSDVVLGPSVGGVARRARYLSGGTYAGTLAVTALAVWWASSLEKRVHVAFGIGQDAYNRGFFQPSLGLNTSETAILFVVVGSMYLWLYTVYSDNGSRIDLPFVATLFPIVLFAMGVDYARWCAIIFNVVLGLVALRVVRSGWRIAPGRASWFVALFLLPVGPVGIGYFFPILRSVWHALVYSKLLVTLRV